MKLGWANTASNWTVIVNCRTNRFSIIGVLFFPQDKFCWDQNTLPYLKERDSSIKGKVRISCSTSMDNEDMICGFDYQWLLIGI
ncbi:MAG: hypothetical protein ACI93L_002206 [Cyclobacteriaceae bacterium]|jgi:hypothetical protein